MYGEPFSKSGSEGNPQTEETTEVNQLGHYMVALSTVQIEPEEPKPTQSEISRVMAELGRRGGW